MNLLRITHGGQSASSGTFMPTRRDSSPVFGREHGDSKYVFSRIISGLKAVASHNLWQTLLLCLALFAVALGSVKWYVLATRNAVTVAALESGETAKSVVLDAQPPLLAFCDGAMHSYASAVMMGQKVDLLGFLDDEWNAAEFGSRFDKVMIDFNIDDATWSHRLGDLKIKDQPVAVVWRAGNPGHACVIMGSGETLTLVLNLGQSPKDLTHIKNNSRWIHKGGVPRKDGEPPFVARNGD